MNAFSVRSILQVFSCNMICKAVLALASAAVIRYMGVAEYAKLTLAYAVAAVLQPILADAMNKIYIVGYKRLGLQQALVPFLGFQLVCFFAIVLLGLPFAGALEGIYWYTALFVLTSCLTNFAQAFFQRELRFISFSLVEIAHTVLYVGALAVIIAERRDLLEAWVVLLLKAVAMSLVFVPVFWGKVKLRELLRIDAALAMAKAVGRSSYRYLYAYYFVLALFSQSDVFMLSFLSDDLNLSTFGSAARYYSFLLMGLSAVHVVLLPHIQQARDASQVVAIFRKQSRMLLYFVPLVLVGMVAAQWIIPWVDQGKYPDAVWVFQILALSSIISFAFSPHSNLLLRFEDFRFLLGLCSSVFVVNVALNAVLIPRYGAVGAAVATFAAFAVHNGGTYLRSRALMASPRVAVFLNAENGTAPDGASGS